MSQLSYAQRQQLLEQAHEIFAYGDEEQRYPEDAVSEIVDSWLPVYYHEIRSAWADAGCPEPEELSTLADAQTIHHAMQLGLYEIAHAELMSVIYNCETHGDSATAIRDTLAMEKIGA